MKSLIGLMLVFALLCSSVMADMIPAGYKSVSYCFTIENQVDYPDYVLVLFGEPLVHGEVIHINDCVPFYKFAQPAIYAIPQNIFDENKLTQLRGEYSQNNQQPFEKYFQNNPAIKKSNLKLENYGLTSKYDPLAAAKDVLRIVTLDYQSFIIEKEKIIYTYEDGSTEEQTYFDQTSFPAPPSQTGFLPWWTDGALIFGGLFLSLVAAITIIVIIVKMIIKKTKNA